MSFRRREFIWKAGLLSSILGFKIPSYGTTENLVENNSDRLVLLGTQGGPFIRSYKQTPSANLIVFKSLHVVIDTGFGVTFKLLDAGVNLALIKYIFITHHHSDHNLELGPLLYNAWISGLRDTIHVYGPVGLNSLISFYWQSNQFDIETRINDEGRPDIRKLVVSHEYSEGILISIADFEVTAMRNIHPPIAESYALKFKLGDKKIVFSGDTAYCPPLAPFASKADYLVHEVMNVAAVEEMVKRRPNASKKLKESIISHHTSVEDAGRIATAAEVKTLVLNHFVPPDDKALTGQVWLDAVKRTFSGNIVIGRDLLQLFL